jgi:pilus assembly protein CpaB
MASEAGFAPNRSGAATGSRPRAIAGRGPGTALVVAGVVLAVVAAAIVFAVVLQAQLLANQGVRQAYVVMVVQDVPEFTTIPQSAIALKPFPAAFAPAGAATSLDQVAGKFTTTRLVRDQVVLAAQVSESRRSDTPSVTIPTGKVAYWMALPDLVAAANPIRAGDRIDLLLSINLTDSQGLGKGLVTQNALQNLEVYFVGTAPTAPGAAGQPAAAGGARVIGLVLDPQEALIVKYVKDSGGTLDLLLRPRDTQERYSMQSVNADTLIDALNFRAPERAVVAGR